MSGFFDNVTIVQKLISTLSWVKLTQFSVLIALVALAWATFENRESIYNFVRQERISKVVPTKIAISKSTREKIVEIVHSSDLIVGTQIVLVDFQKNTRRIVLSEFDITEVRDVYSKFVDGTFDEYPLFNDDVSNNQRLIKLINGEFVCAPYAVILSAKMLPETAKYIDTACGTGIPPFYGQFTGIIIVFLKKTPTPVEIDQLRNLIKTLSTTIYNRDLR